MVAAAAGTLPAVRERLAAIAAAGVTLDVPCESITREGSDLAAEVHAAARAANTQLLVIGRELVIEPWGDGPDGGTRTLAEAEGAIPWDAPAGEEEP